MPAKRCPECKSFVKKESYTCPKCKAIQPVEQKPKFELRLPLK